MITTGEHSDYTVRDHLRALRGFDAIEEARRFRREGDFMALPPWDSGGQLREDGSDDRFLAWAIREGLVAPTAAGEIAELHIGSYGRLELGS